MGACQSTPIHSQPTTDVKPTITRNQLPAISPQTATLTPTPPAPLKELTTPTPALAISPSPAPSSTEQPPQDAWVAEVRYEPWELVLALEWSPQGEWLAVTAGNNLYLYEAISLQERHRLPLSSWAEGMAFNPGVPGQLALAGRDGFVQLWDVGVGMKQAQWQAHPKGAKSAAFSPDGDLLASTGSDALVRLWDIRLLEDLDEDQAPPSVEMIGGAFAVPDICFSPDGTLVASVDGNDIRLRDPQTQRLVRTLRGDYAIFSLAFSPDGRWLAAAEMGNVVRLWDIQSGETFLELVRFEGRTDDPKQFFWSATFSPDGKVLAAGGSDGWITVWHALSGEVIDFWQAHGRAVTGVAFNPDGRLASGGLDARVRVWEARWK